MAVAIAVDRLIVTLIARCSKWCQCEGCNVREGKIQRKSNLSSISVEWESTLAELHGSGAKSRVDECHEHVLLFCISTNDL